MDVRRPAKAAADLPPVGLEQRFRRLLRGASGPVAGTVTVAILLAAACSLEHRHHVLTFFFDGVPPPATDVAAAETQKAGEGLLAEAVEPKAEAEAGKIFYNHPAYQQNRCGECHDVERGGLIKTAREGLCLTCHPEKPGKKKFSHGPMAVNGCLACHRYHRSAYPKVLVADAQTLCFHCHEMGELRTDEHHATMQKERCIDCHDAHGGDDRYFLIRKEGAVDVIPKEGAVDSS
jgi:predicted CXXCH cytochrome family protein